MAQRQWRSDDTVKWTYGFGNGSDGDLTISSNTTEAPIDSSCSGTAAASTLSATNASFAPGQLILIHQTRGTGAGGWELAKISAYTAGTITLDKPLQNTYTDSGASQAQVRVMKQYNNVTVDSGVTWTGKSWNKNVGGIFGFFAKGTVTITGTISANGGNGETRTSTSWGGGATVGGFSGGNAIRTSADHTAYQGEGTSGAGGATTAANGNGGGGGAGIDTFAGGGGGGNATNGGTGGNIGSGGAGGSSVGTSELTTINLGGGGGGGARDWDATYSGTGASGAGICFIFAKELEISGLIRLNGGTGGSGGSGAGTGSGGGGGGAGGSCLIKSITATLGTSKITATGGSGGGGIVAGGAGSVGRIHIDYSGSISGTTTPTLDATLDPTIKHSAGMMQAMQMLMMQ